MLFVIVVLAISLMATIGLLVITMVRLGKAAEAAENYDWLRDIVRKQSSQISELHGKLMDGARRIASMRESGMVEISEEEENLEPYVIDNEYEAQVEEARGMR